MTTRSLGFEWLTDWYSRVTIARRLASNLQRKVLLISNSAIGPQMSGPGIRYWEFARVLSETPGLTVTLVTTPGVMARPPGDTLAFCVVTAQDERELRSLASVADVVVAPGSLVGLFPSLDQIDTPLALDLYIPRMLEELQRAQQRSLTENALVFDRLRRELCAQVMAADYFLCASEQQRDYWLGALSALGRVNPYTHGDDPTLRRLIDVVPFGLPSYPPSHTRQVMKGVYPGIRDDDKVLLWGGGIWDWLDTATLLRAMSRLVDVRPDIKLFFMGVKHPNPHEGLRKGTREMLRFADELGLTGRTVFFNDWVAYEERANYLLEADVGVSLHRDHLESRFSFRTRFLDNLWAGLPLIATRGDVLSQLIERRGLGRVVEPGDVDGLVTAILELVAIPDLRQSYETRFQCAAEAFHWEKVTRPLAFFCQNPRRAPDVDYLRTLPRGDLDPTPWWRLPIRAWRVLRSVGVEGFAREAKEYRRWLINRRGDWGGN